MPDDKVTSADTPIEGSVTSHGVKENAQHDKARPFGWGADLPLENRPAVPKERFPARLEGVHWDHPEQQPQHVEVLCSVERPGITPIFGSAQPPSGASGVLRRYAFRFSESDLRHWLLLLAADRINVVEGVVGDLASGRVPNVPAEMGARAEFTHNPRGAARKIGFIAVALTVLYLARRNSRRR